MKYFSFLHNYIGFKAENYTLEQYRLWHRRWQILGILSLLYFMYLITSSPAAVEPVDHLAKVVVNLNPANDRFVESQLKRAASDPHAKGILLFIEEGIYDGNGFATAETLENYVQMIKKTKPVVSYIYGYAHANSYVLVGIKYNISPGLSI